MSNIGERIKRYEKVYDYKLTPRSCLFVRVDGKSFHTFTKNCNKPFDQQIINAMVEAALHTAKQMPGFKLAYIQSDECTFMLTDFDNIQTQGWFNYELNKVVSISAAYYTAYFNKFYGSKDAVFDSRAFIVPQDDAPNVFIWRQQDWERNSVQMLAQSQFNQRELQGKKIPEIHEMLLTKNLDWSKLSPQLKNGTFITQDFQFIYDKLHYDNIKEII